MVFPAEIDYLKKASAFAFSPLKKFDVSKKSYFSLELLFEEIFTNIAQHSYASGVFKKKDKLIKIKSKFDDKKNEIKIVFEDNGISFNPLKKNAPIFNEKNIQDKPVGGLGIYIIKNSIDEINYERKKNQNSLTILKKI